MGVPLEEMDAVFGEEELEERMDNESDDEDDENAALLREELPSYGGETGARRRARGWFGSMFKGDEGSATAQATN